MPQHLQVLLSSSAQVAVVSVLETVCSLPAQTCHRQLYLDVYKRQLLACLLILLYNGKRGKLKLKYFFYVFYPAHILVPVSYTHLDVYKRQVKGNVTTRQAAEMYGIHVNRNGMACLLYTSY